MKRAFQNSRSRARGFNLVELMIGLTIALVFLLVVAGIFSNANQQKNTTSSGADAQTSGAIASHIIEREARMAGFGLNVTDLLGCEIYSYDSQSSRSFVFSAVPAIITAGNTTVTASNPFGTPDSLTLSYGNSDVGYSSAKLSSANTGDNTNFKVTNRFGFHMGDVIVVAEPIDRYSPTAGAPTSGTNSVNDCVLAQVNSLPPGVNSNNIGHDSSTYTDAQGHTGVTPRYNKSTGLGISFTTNAEIYNFGSAPVSATYTINTRAELTRVDIVDSASVQAVADNIVMMRAQYGKDTDGDGTVDTWDQVTPTTVDLWRQVRAIQFAIVARSQKKEGTMVTATSLVLWPGGPTLVLSDDQRKYRYKVFSSLVPLRNMIWSAS